MEFSNSGIFYHFSPEVILFFTIMISISVQGGTKGWMGRLFTSSKRRRGFLFFLSLVALSTATVVSFLGHNATAKVMFSGALKIDEYTLFIRSTFLSLSVLTVFCLQPVLMNDGLKQEAASVSRENNSFERVLTLLLGIFLLGSILIQTEEVLLFLGIFFSMGILTILVVASSSASEEEASTALLAACKYSVSHLISTAFLVLGFGVLIFVSDKVKISEIAIKLLNVGGSNPVLIWVGAVMVLAGLLAGIGTFPFSFFAPDVARGIRPEVTAAILIHVRLVLVLAMLHLFLGAFSQPLLELYRWVEIVGIDWKGVVAVSAAATMLYGGLLSLNRNRFREVMGFWWMQLSGLVVLGLLVTDKKALVGFHFYVFSEAISWLGALSVLGFFMEKYKGDTFDKFRGSISTYPLESITLLVAMASLAGLPPFPTFVGRFSIVQAAYREGWHLLILATIIGWALQLGSFGKMCSAIVARDLSKQEQNKESSIQVQEQIRRGSFQWATGLLLLRFWVPAVLSIVLAGVFWKKTGEVLEHILW